MAVSDPISLGESIRRHLALPSEADLPQPQPRMRRCAEHGEWDPVVRGASGESRHLPRCPVCASARAGEALVSRAAIPPRFRDRRLDTYVAEIDGQRAALDVARDYVADLDRTISAGRCLVLLGRPGTGKTHLACAIAHQALARGRSALYATVMDVIRAVRGTWRRDADTTEQAMLAKFSAVDVLVLDEVGVQFGTDAERVTLFDVLNRRYLDCRPTILISNETTEGLKKYIGERMFDRLREGGGRVVIFDWDSHRGRHA